MTQIETSSGTVWCKNTSQTTNEALELAATNDAPKAIDSSPFTWTPRGISLPTASWTLSLTRGTQSPPPVVSNAWMLEWSTPDF